MNRFTTALLAGVGMAIAAASTAHAQQVNVASGVSPVFGAPFIADEKGFFKDAGLDVSIKTFQAGAAANEAFRSGGFQYLVTCDQPAMMMAASGEASIISMFNQTQHMVWMLGHKDVKGPADLKGKKIGVFRKSASEFMLEQYLKSGGLTTKDVEMVHLAPFDQIPAVVKGDVAALSLWKPFDLKVFGLSKDFKILADTGSMGYTLYCGMLVNRKYGAANPGEVDKFMKAVKRATDYLVSNPKEANASIAKFVKLPVEEVEHVIGGEGWSMEVNDAMMKQLRALEKFMLDLELIKAPVDWNTAVDWSYTKRLDPKLVKTSM
jgi:ABC-type nitrate/sulfonate/bicarbonate transport system substrate-binding protein